MIIDSTHKPWAVITLLFIVVSSILYALYAMNAPNGPSGGSIPGLAFGVLATVLMLIVGGLSVRKKLPRRQLGTAQSWLRAHLWLGVLTVPCVLFHAGFQFGGLLEQVLMWVFALIIISGLFGAALQHFVPRLMQTTVTTSTMYEQIPQVRNQLRQTADERIKQVCGSLMEPPAKSELLESSALAGHQLKEFYLQLIRPYLAAEQVADGEIATATKANARFAVMRENLPADGAAELHQTLSQLGDICRERRVLDRQASIHRWLHGWLFIHIPLSCSLLVLAAAHIFMSLYY